MVKILTKRPHFIHNIPAFPHTLASAQLLQGKPLSYNNLLDSDAALNCVRALDPTQAACAIIKHATPCGVAQAATLCIKLINRR